MQVLIFCSGLIFGLAIGAIFAISASKASAARIADMQKFLIARGASRPLEGNSELPEDPTLAARPSDEEIPEKLVEICMLFPQDGTRMLRDARVEHSRGTPWKVIIQQFEQEIDRQNPGALIRLLPDSSEQGTG